MGTCKFCGQKSGLFSNSHKECEIKHNEGLKELETVVNAYSANAIHINEFSTKIKQLKREKYITDAEVATYSLPMLNSFADSIKRPIQPSFLKRINDFRAAVDVKWKELNQNGIIDTIAQKLLRGYMVDYFTDKSTLQQACDNANTVTSTLPVTADEEKNAYWYVLSKAATNFLKDDAITNTERQKVEAFINRLSLPMNNVPSVYAKSDIDKLSQAITLCGIQNGQLPRFNFSAPIMLSKGEQVLWEYRNVSFYQEKTERYYSGRSGGFTFTICKGVKYRTGQFKGHPIEQSRMVLVERGILYVTNKNLIFYSQTKGAKIPYDKIIGIAPYSDGIEILKDGNSKRMTFAGFDCWFILNLISQLNNTI